MLFVSSSHESHKALCEARETQEYVATGRGGDAAPPYSERASFPVSTVRDALRAGVVAGTASQPATDAASRSTSTTLAGVERSIAFLTLHAAHLPSRCRRGFWTVVSMGFEPTFPFLWGVLATKLRDGDSAGFGQVGQSVLLGKNPQSLSPIHRGLNGQTTLLHTPVNVL